MVNFIVCEDDDKVRKIVTDIIASIMMPRDTDYKIYEHNCYNSSLAKFINSAGEGNIYILDIEFPNKSGFDIARRIREKDWNSIIIFSTAHYELCPDAIKNRLMILDFISKFNDYEQSLKETLKLAIKIVDDKKSIVFKSAKTLHKIRLDDIIYIMKETFERKTIIKTAYGAYKINKNISEVYENLDSRFFQSHRSCIVNIDHIKLVDFKEGKIIFNNGEHIYLLSRNKKKELRSYVSNNK